MHLRKHLLYIFAGLLILALFYFFALSNFFRPPQLTSYENFTDISEAYDATDEIEAAQKAYAQSPAQAAVIQGNPNNGQVIYLTFNGMESRGNMDAILKILRDRGLKVSFFVEGANAAHEETIIQKMQNDGHLIGNYSFVGLTKAERLDTARLLEQFCKTQKVLELTTGAPAAYFALPDTRYLPALLRAAKASGLDYAVASTLTITESDLTQPDGVTKLLAQIQPGMILSIRLDHPVPIQFYNKEDVDPRPAIDKGPTIVDAPPQTTKNVSIVDAVAALCDGLAEAGYTTAPVSELTTPVNT